jgi:hypothetical protein
MTLRNLFLGLEVSQDEKRIIKDTFSKKESRRIVRKIVMPEFDTDIPVGMETDYWMSSVDGIKGNTPETLAPIVASQFKYVEMLEKALKLLENPDGDKVNLKVIKLEDATEMYQQILARNNFVSVIAQAIVRIKVLAGNKNETIEEQAKRLEKNSSK